VESFLEYWDAHRAVLWSRNVAVNEGDQRFRSIRDQAFTPMIDALRFHIDAAQRRGAVDPAISARALATTLVVMIDRIGMLSPHVIEPYDSADALVEAVAYVFDRVLGIRTDADLQRASTGRRGVKRRSGAASGTTRRRASS
jgi:hypothetical protein